jgi:large subunit ribosomal protein L4
VGGGQSFGPQPRDYTQATPKKMMEGALRSVLSDRFKAGRILIVDEFKFAEIKTKPFVDMLQNKFKLEKVLIVDDANRNMEISSRNVPHCKVLRTEGLNCYDIVGNEWLVLSKRALERVESRLGTAE